jgi:hypothetical protein
LTYQHLFDLNLHRTLLIAFNSIGARTYLGSVKIQKNKIKEEKSVLIITYVHTALSKVQTCPLSFKISLYLVLSLFYPWSFCTCSEWPCKAKRIKADNKKGKILMDCFDKTMPVVLFSWQVDFCLDGLEVLD